MKRSRDKRVIRCLTALFLCAVFLFTGFAPAAAIAKDTGKTVRVGWYESSFCTKDKAGRRSGYAYEYQMKIASYTGWNYEYVEGSWSELLEMLRKGEIDMLSDVSYTDERASQMLYPELPMGAEVYYIFIAPSNKDIKASDYSTLNGKRIGVNKDSIQADMYRKWADMNDVDAELIELVTEEDESIKMLEDGKLDAYITPDAFSDPERLMPYCKIGSSDFFFVLNKGRKDLLAELNMAMSSIQDENRNYNEQMSEEYLLRSGVTAFLTEDELKWLKEHGPVKVGYQDNYMAFCAKDEETGELKGALKDYLEYASDCLQNAHINYEAVAYPTAEAAMDAVKKGEVDCVFPANLSTYDGEERDIIMTPYLISSNVIAVVRPSESKSLMEKSHVIVAVNEGNPNYDGFLMDNFPDWRVVYYPDTAKCLKAVSKGVADCVLLSNYCYSNVSRLCDRYGLTSFDTGVRLDYCFAVKSGNNNLYSILAKSIGVVPKSTVNSLLSYYVSEDAKSTLKDYIFDNLEIFTVVLFVILAIILALLIKSRRAERKAREIISATETDDLTGLYNRDFFLEYAGRMHSERPNKDMDALVFNIEQFHTVNAMNGRDFGDQVLRALGSEMLAIASENGGIAGRFQADRFDIYCKHTDDYQAIYDRVQNALDEITSNSGVRMRMGVMTSQPELDVVQQFDMARTACSMARGQYNDHLVVFDDEVREREVYEQHLLNDFRRAIDGYEFEVHYQPKYDIRGDKPRLVSAEALIRWIHPEFGMIPPDDFIPLFERSGMIGELDKYVWNEAVRQIVRWKEMYGRTIPISVNLSRVDVFDPTLEKTLDDILTINGLDHSVLMLEVTETAYTENSDQVIKVVEGLRSDGYKVEMDDFGTGYSSLNMLSEMPVDVVKMDRIFVRNMEHDEKDIRMVALILDLAKQLNVPVVAEGVETETQLNMLRELGCDVVQGYYFSRPLPSTEFEVKIIEKSIQEEEN